MAACGVSRSCGAAASGRTLATVDAYLESDRGASAEALLVRGLANTDMRVSDGKPVTPSFLFALLLYGQSALD